MDSSPKWLLVVAGVVAGLIAGVFIASERDQPIPVMSWEAVTPLAARALPLDAVPTTFATGRALVDCGDQSPAADEPRCGVPRVVETCDGAGRPMAACVFYDGRDMGVDGKPGCYLEDPITGYPQIDTEANAIGIVTYLDRGWTECQKR